MPQLEQITIAPGLTFDALAAGEAGAPLVLLLHGFAESMHCWRAQVAALANAAIARSRRASAAIRRARGRIRATSNYHIDRLMDDAMAIAAASGYGDARFHLVGHDWGGSIAWALADRYPSGWPRSRCCRGRIPNAFNRALQMPDGEQARRSRHHKAFLEPDARRRRACRRRQMAARSPSCQRRSRRRRSSSISPYLATRTRWKRRWPGIARAARSAVRSARSACRRSSSGATPTTPSGAPRPKAR